MAEKEYIEREALIRTIENIPDNELLGNDNITFVELPTVLDIISEQPTSDVQEVRHGRWLPKHYEGGLLGGSNVDECSECGYERLIRDMKYRTVYKYCPNCGAKMDMDKE